MLTGELHAVNQKLSVEEQQRKTIENELVRLKKVVPENDHDFEVSFTVEFNMVYTSMIYGYTHTYIHTYMYIYKERDPYANHE